MKKTILMAVLAILLVLPLTLADAGDYGYGMMGMMYGSYGLGMMIFSWLFGILVAVALILFIVWLIKQIQKK